MSRMLTLHEVSKVPEMSRIGPDRRLIDGLVSRVAADSDVAHVGAAAPRCRLPFRDPPSTLSI